VENRNKYITYNPVILACITALYPTPSRAGNLQNASPREPMLQAVVMVDDHHKAQSNLTICIVSAPFYLTIVFYSNSHLQKEVKFC